MPGLSVSAYQADLFVMIRESSSTLLRIIADILRIETAILPAGRASYALKRGWIRG